MSLSLENGDIVAGRNPVYEVLKSKREINKILIAKGINRSGISGIISMAIKRNIVIQEVDRHELDCVSSGIAHQGIVAFVSVYRYSSLEDIFDTAKARVEDPFILVLDKVKDPHNLGAIIRTAECSGVHGVIIPKDNAATLNYTVAKTAAGALEYVHVSRVTNITNTIKELQKRGVWVYATSAAGTSIYDANLSGAIALVLGNEGKGISRLVSESCDMALSLPMQGNISSLNVSVAAGIFMYEVVRTRRNL